jgi:hypothetical protein
MIFAAILIATQCVILAASYAIWLRLTKKKGLRDEEPRA